MDEAMMVMGERYRVMVNHFEPDAHAVLFNRIDYFRLHAAGDDDAYFQLMDQKNGRVVASLAFHACGEGRYRSPKNGTFGGLSINEPIDLGACEAFYAAVLDDLRARGARHIEIKCRPCGHDVAGFSIEANILLRHGFLIDNHELNYEMAITDAPFVERVAYNNAKRMRKCERDGMIAEQVDLSHYGQVYDVIRDNRERRGFPITMSREQIHEMIELFPEHMHLFAVYASGEKTSIHAAAICLSLSSDVLYVFYWGDAADMASYSPISLLAKKIYEFAQAHGFRILDTGISTVGGEPNHGLVTFKRNLGFSESLKLTFAWQDHAAGAAHP